MTHEIRSVLLALAAAVVALVGARVPAASAQTYCGGWDAMNVVGSVNNAVYRMQVLDLDGAGPQPPSLAVAGAFTSAGGLRAGGLMLWRDGVITALDPEPSLAWKAVYSVAAGDGVLAVLWQGTYDPEPGNRVSTWDGERWTHLPGRISGSSRAPLVYFDGRFWIGAAEVRFRDGTRVYGDVLMWDGAEWSAIPDHPTAFTALVGTAGGELFFTGLGLERHTGGPTGAMVSWDGVNWKTYGAPVTYSWQLPGVSALTQTSIGLLGVAGAQFPPNHYVVKRYESATGSWETLGSPLRMVLGTVREIAVLDGAPVVFASDEGLGPQLRRFDGVDWRPVAGPANPVQSEVIDTLANFEGGLWVGGRLTSMGGVAFANLGVLRDGVWGSPMPGANAGPRVLTRWNGDLVALGPFTSIEGEPIRFAARRTPTGWAPMGDPVVQMAPGYAEVRSAVVHDGKLHVAGAFATLNGAPTTRLLVYDGTGWTARPDPGTTAVVLKSFGGDLWAASGGGIWRSAGGAGAWGRIFTDEAHDLEVHDGQLFAATRLGIYRWTGSSFAAHASLPQLPTDLQSANGELFVVAGGLGLFRVLPGQVQAVSVPFGAASALATFGGRLVVWGSTSAPVYLSFGVVREGAGWSVLSPPGGGRGPWDEAAMLEHGGALWLAGGAWTDGRNYSVLRYTPGRACAPDMNNDGELTFDDVQRFVGAYAAGSREADMNCDEEVTFEDVTIFVAVYNAGC